MDKNCDKNPIRYIDGERTVKRKTDGGSGMYDDFAIVGSIDPTADYSDSFNCENFGELMRVHDDVFNELLPRLNDLPTYLHSMRNPYLGLDHYSATIIPPESVGILRGIAEDFALEKNYDLDELLKLLEKAEKINSYVICFGI